MSTIGKGMLTAGVIIAALAPVKKAAAQNADKMNPKPLTTMAEDLGDRVILTYHGKGKNMNIDHGASDLSIKRRLHGWGFKDAFTMPMKKLKKVIHKADTSEYKGIVTANELKGVGIDVNADSRLAKKILELQSLSENKTNAESYHAITRELDNIAQFNKDDASMIADDPIISELTKSKHLGPAEAAVAHLGVKSDHDAVEYAFKTGVGHNGNISQNSLQPITYFSKELNGNKVIIIPTMKKGPVQVPYIPGNDASGARAFTKTADGAILELDYGKNGFSLKPSDEKPPIESSFRTFIDNNFD